MSAFSFSNFGKSSAASTTPATSTAGATTGGLFGGLGAAKPASGGLFGNLGTPSSATNAPATSTAAPAGSGSPFGGSLGGGSGGLSGGLGGGLGGASKPSGLFSNLGGTSTAAAPGATTTAGGGLFGGLGTSTANPPASTPAAASLFGQPAATQTSQPGGLFSATSAQPAATNAQQTGPLFSTSTAPTQQQQQSGLPTSQSNAGASKSAHFDHLLERGRKRNAGEHGFGNFEELPTLQLGLGDIARKVRNLGTGGPSADQATHDRAAHHLLAASGVKLGSTLRDLNQFTSQAGLSTAGPASTTLLDTDVDSYISTLHSQSTLALIQDGLEQSKRDFDTFLEENVQIEWDAQRKRIYDHFGLGKQSEEMAASQSTFGRTARGAFGRSRKGRSMGPGASVNGSSFGPSGAAPVLGSVGPGYQGRAPNGTDSLDRSNLVGQSNIPDRFMREKQERYAEKVKDLNEARLSEEKFYPLLHIFRDVEQSSEVEHQEHYVNAYKALIAITGEHERPESGVTEPKARCFATKYLEQDPNSASSVEIRKRILNGARSFLEKKFFEEAMDTITKHAGEARPGGVPSYLSKIKGFIQVKSKLRELADVDELQSIGNEEGEYPWVIIFYLLRCGLVNEAAAYVREKRNFFQSQDRLFAQAMLSYADDPDRRLPSELHQKMGQTYAQRTRIAPVKDPYKMACYKIVGRCELSRRTLDITQSMDDWVWLQFNLAREGNRAEENAGEVFGLAEIRDSITEIGQRHFQNSAEAAGGYGVYFYLATLAGMFEHAINYLYPYNYMTAVHFAIALGYYGLLRVSDWHNAGSEILTYTQRQQPELNFGRMVGHYTAEFRTARADSAAEYLFLICLNADLPGDAGKEQANLCHEALRELVLETREFSTLLGDVKANGQSTLGIIKQRLPLISLTDEDALVKSITQEAARTADDNGRTNDAVLLCHLAGEYDLVVSILNRSLSDALSVEIGQEPLRLEPLKERLPTADAPAADPSSTSSSLLGTDDPIELAGRIITLYNNNQLWWSKVSDSNRNTLGQLFTLNQAKHLLEKAQPGHYMQTLDTIERLNLLPINANGNLTTIRSVANSFSTLAPEITRNIGNVLLWCIACCSRHREYLLSGKFEDPTKKAMADKLLQTAKDLMVFAGLIRYKLPPRVFEMLAREGGDVGGY